ncbi:MAG: hypothetical protein CME32_01190 [Gimesia sp.]|nr:hypothetical protein [Gimesia sp.]
MPSMQPPLPSDDSDALEEIIDAFEQAWSSGSVPQINEFLPEAPALRSQLLIELVHSDLDFRMKQDMPVEIEHYLQEYPELENNEGVLKDLIQAEFEFKQRRHPLTHPREYWERFPTHSELLQDLFPDVDTNETVIQAEGQSTYLFESDNPDSPSMLPDQASRFGEYALLEEISRGGMGIVYKAQHRQLKRTVALKLILSGRLADEEQIKRFDAEAEAAAKLDHPGIVPVYNFGKVDGAYFIEMAFVEGKSLSELVSSAPLEAREAAQILLKVTRGIQHAHEKGIIHRDIKPANILIDQTGQPRVTDFGLAKQVESDSSLTATGQVMGTPSYMPPEQAQGTRDLIDVRSDIYSLGATLYELLTGKPPFQNASVIETLVQVVENDPVSPSQLVMKLSADLETICMKCLEKSPANRYQSATELADELERFLNGEPIHARPTTRITQFWRWCKRKPGAALAGLSVLVAILIVGVGLFLSYQAQRRQLLTEAERRFDQSLKTPNLTSDYRDKIQLQLNEIARLDSTLAAEARQRFHDTFSNTIAGIIHQPNLSENDKSQIEDALKFVNTYDETEATSLRKEYQDRLGRWQPVFQQSAPFPEIDSQFTAGQVKQVDQKLYPVSATKNQVTSTLGGERILKLDQAIYLKVPSTSMSQFKVVFDKTWQQTTQLGLILNGDPESQSGYAFLLKTRNELSRVSVGFDEFEIRDAPASERSFNKARSLNQSVTAEIRKNGVSLISKEIPISELKAAEIKLSVFREDDLLSFQINQLPPIQHQDIFPIYGNQTEVLGIDWPRNCGLIDLQAFHKQQKATTGSTLAADKKYASGQFEQALLLYRKQLDLDLKNENKQELRYKLALCQIALNQFDVAEPVLFQILNESEDEHWSSLAGCQLWLMLLKQKKYEEADVIYESISTRFDFESLIRSVPHELRQEIVSHYSQSVGSLMATLTYDPQRIQKLKVAAQVDKLLTVDGVGTQRIQLDLVEAYEMAGDLKQALVVLDELWKNRHRDSLIALLRARFLRISNQPQEALQIVTALMERPGLTQYHKCRYLLERGYINCALGNWPGAEQDIETGWRILKNFPLEKAKDLRCLISAIRGFLQYQKGNAELARQMWGAGYNSIKPSIKQGGLTPSLAGYVMLIGSLSHEMTDQEANRIVEIYISALSSHPLSGLTKTVGSKRFSNVIMHCWKTPRGLKYARELAFRLHPQTEKYRLTLSLIFIEFAREMAFHGGTLSSVQEQEIFNLANDFYDGFFRSGEINISHVIPLAATLKGQVGFLGWGGVAHRLGSSRRARMAYIFAHYYLERKQVEQARKFFEEAKTHAEPDTALSRLVEEDQELLNKQSGQIFVRSNLNQAVKIRFLQGEKVIRKISAKNGTSFDLPAGTYQIELESGETETKLQQKEFVITPTVRKPLQITGKWGMNEEQSTMPGLVPYPAEIPGLSRWQVIPRATSYIVDHVACSPDGKNIACGDRNGMIRVYRAGTFDILHVFSGHTRQIRGLAWAPDSNRLASISLDHTLRIWDLKSGSE